MVGLDQDGSISTVLLLIERTSVYATKFYHAYTCASNVLNAICGITDALVRLKLPDETRVALDRHCKRWGIDQIIVISRIIEWVATQPQEVISMIFVLNRPDCHEEIAQKIFEEMARGR